MNQEDKIKEIKDLCKNLKLDLSEETLLICVEILENKNKVSPESLVAILDEIKSYKK